MYYTLVILTVNGIKSWFFLKLLADNYILLNSKNKLSKKLIQIETSAITNCWVDPKWFVIICSVQIVGCIDLTSMFSLIFCELFWAGN